MIKAQRPLDPSQPPPHCFPARAPSSRRALGDKLSSTVCSHISAKLRSKHSEPLHPPPLSLHTHLV
jgi:hypothetical protein